MNAATVFVHGFNGDAYSTDHLLSFAEESGCATKVLNAYIRRNGRIEFTGEWSDRIDNPMVQVIFENNRAPERRQVRWVRNLLVELKERFGVDNYNGVGHSLGSNVLVNLGIKYGDDAKLPRLNKLVTIAGPFNGLHGFWSRKPIKSIIDCDWEPTIKTHHFQKLLKMRDRFPKGVDVLNVVGQVEGSLNNDVYVSVQSARSVGYLLDGVVNKYHEIMVTGPDGYHCSLNQNDTVSREINNFLWNYNRQVADFKLITSKNNSDGFKPIIVRNGGLQAG